MRAYVRECALYMVVMIKVNIMMNKRVDMLPVLFRVILFLCMAVVYVRAEPAVLENPSYKLEIYRLKFSDSASVLPMLKDIYAHDADVRMAGTGSKLFIRASSKQHAEIAAVVNELDIKRKNVRIDVKFIGSGKDSSDGVAVKTHGGVIYNKDGLSGNITLKPSIHSRSTTTSSSTTQILMAMSGTRASLRIGERIPYLTWIMDYGFRYGLIAGSVEWQDVGSFLSIEPEIIGDGPMIRVKLVPELSGLVDGKRRQIRFIQAATEVTVRDGQSVQIGGASKSSEFLSRFLVGVDRQGSSSALSIVLTPRIMDDRMMNYDGGTMKNVQARPKGW